MAGRYEADVYEWLHHNYATLKHYDSQEDIAEDIKRTLGLSGNGSSIRTIRRYIGWFERGTEQYKEWQSDYFGGSCSDWDGDRDELMRRLEEADKENAPGPDKQNADEPENVAGFQPLDKAPIQQPDGSYVWYNRFRERMDRIPKEMYEGMLRDYSNWDGKDLTKSEICGKYELHPNEWESLKRDAGWVHASAPVTDETLHDMATGEVDRGTVARDIVQRQKKLLWDEVQRQKQEGLEQDARRWRKFKSNELDPLAEYVITNPPRRDPIKFSGEQQPFMAVFSPADLHLLKRAKGYDVPTARRLLFETTDRLVENVYKRGIPEKNALILGNDWSHVDNPRGETTRGTPQDVDGEPRRAPEVAFDTAGEYIDRMRSLGHVDVYVVLSNHCEWTDASLAAGLRFGYRDYDDVTIHVSLEPRQYLRYGNNLIGLEHGDGAKDRDLPTIMANEVASVWGECRWRSWLLGHLHHLEEKDYGAHIMRAPSLTPADYWHKKKGYTTADRANVAYIFERENGPVGRELSLIEGDEAECTHLVA